MFCASIAIVGTNLNANEKEKANSYGIFIEIIDKVNSLGSTVRKNNENAEIIMHILRIIAIAKSKDKKRVFKIMIKRNKKDKPLMLLAHIFKIFPEIKRGRRLSNMIKRGMISVNNNAFIV